jgi:hypothetical protein
MRPGKTLEPGDIIVASVQFTETPEIKTMPAVILFEELENVVIAGITSNLKMKGIPLTISEGAIKDIEGIGQTRCCEKHNQNQKVGQFYFMNKTF